MVCLRCKIVVKTGLQNLGIPYSALELGQVDVDGDISIGQLDQFRAILLQSGLELLDDRKSILIQKIKNVIIELVHNSEAPYVLKLSRYLSEKLNHDYNYLSNLFSEVQGSTIEKFFISHRIERAKELLVYDELTLTEISKKMHYRSVSHLSAQFKKVTGLTPSHYKRLKHKRRSMLEDL